MLPSLPKLPSQSAINREPTNLTAKVSTRIAFSNYKSALQQKNLEPNGKLLMIHLHSDIAASHYQSILCSQARCWVG